MRKMTTAEREKFKELRARMNNDAGDVARDFLSKVRPDKKPSLMEHVDETIEGLVPGHELHQIMGNFKIVLQVAVDSIERNYPLPTEPAKPIVPAP